MSTLSGRGPPTASANQTILKASNIPSGYGTSSAAASGVTASGAGGGGILVGPHGGRLVPNPETKCSRTTRILMLACTLVTAIDAVIMFYLVAAANGLSIINIAAILLLFVQTGAGIYVAFTRSKCFMALFSIFCLVNGLAVGTYLVMKANEPKPEPTPPPLPTLPTLPPTEVPDNSTTTEKPRTSTTIKVRSTTKKRGRREDPFAAGVAPTLQPNQPVIEITTDTRALSEDHFLEFQRASLEHEREELLKKGKKKKKKKKRKKKPDHRKDDEDDEDEDEGGGSTTKNSTEPTRPTLPPTPAPLPSTTTEDPSVVTTLEPAQKMAIVYALLWFSICMDLIMSLISCFIMASVGSEPGRQLYGESAMPSTIEVGRAPRVLLPYVVGKAPVARSSMGPKDAASKVASRSRIGSAASSTTSSQVGPQRMSRMFSANAPADKKDKSRSHSKSRSNSAKRASGSNVTNVSRLSALNSSRAK